MDYIVGSAAQVTAENWFWLLWMGGISSGLAYVFYYKGLQWSSPIIASVVTLLGPVVGVTLSVALLDESFTVVQVAGIIGLLVTGYFLSTLDLGLSGRPAAQPSEQAHTASNQESTETVDVRQI